ncbi:sulfate/thiosulfate ABC transporter substrate-binding protein cysp1 [Rhodococcus ruber BKS 20-38]|uniref:Sulfate/thiosulfate ABC transporter substrate-binding protein cysp1 n=1 Tax=Rhodococcus ruber BKS 20-38 TaxID=1278076 RepID=M2XQE6_9NOCA|nr:extracellular solute-binding protein [Rhodococcus ruber]EME63236.1 sulfate/thiosulfate ABC transporter substrate-binding protein cysp1 [Rhodococcus ruber BKS 20-38]
MRFRPSRHLVALAAAAALTACSAGDGQRADDDAAAGSGPTVDLSAAEGARAALDEVIAAFGTTEAGEDVRFDVTSGPSAQQAAAVVGGASADFVTFASVPDLSGLVDAGLVDPDWNAGVYRGIPYGSVVTMLVREGNPWGVTDWDDLLAPGLEVVTPDPTASGAGELNLLAAYAATSNGGADPQAGRDYLAALVGDHIESSPASPEEAVEVFVQGAGDVLLLSERDAVRLERDGAAVRRVPLATTLRIDSPAVVIDNAPDVVAAQEFNDFLYTAQAQRIWASSGFRPADPGVAREFADDFPAPETLWTVDDLGGWSAVEAELFRPGTGGIAVIYAEATR